jgi:hypothetical protein
VIDAIHKLMEKETAGDPISGVKWTRKTTGKIAGQLKRLGIAVSRNAVGRLLRRMNYSLRTNRKTISAGSTSDRHRQSAICAGNGIGLKSEEIRFLAWMPKRGS